ncbi:RNA polymerase factor sigma-54 [Telmatospirillum sp.]|uniref:RNA polymerase factor sigma-54 n=1 Tax=Telmatospirillum sp. TaxID=2079197 RepID=UPI00284F3845|nr:RNA polymerase factor sigma-54 [Telmatospirillum sp.]MDR3439539.1 RNA polymerase factor sigma-54 [Telmatospirillum sp.]
MALTPRLDLRQTQSLVMTPQLQQAIKLLQLSNLELTTFIEQELERNPLLETDDRERAATDEAPGEVDSRTADEPLVDSLPGQAEEAPLDLDYDNTFNNDSPADGSDGLGDWGGRGGRLDFENGESNYEQTVARDVSLRDHLTGQLNMDVTDPADRLIGVHLIEMLDESGYLIGSLDDVAEKLACPVERVETVLTRLQRFEPPGLFARSLAECLALQLRDKNRFDPAMQCLLDHLDLLARRDFSGLMRLCGVDTEDLTEMIAEIRALDPKPALAFDHVVAQPITPDVLMRAAPGGGWIVELNSETLPRVLVNTRYYTKVVTAARNKEEKTYLSERFQSANWLVKSLHQRATTILKVASELVRQQEAFFQKGIQHLRPLVLRDIATAISMHESTVSRVTANKYMATPRGIYELKYFFTQAIAGSDGGEAHSAESVRYRIKALIDAEAPNDILSDDRIVDILKAESVDIARRTVAKYREAMHISSSVQRRREKATER